MKFKHKIQTLAAGAILSTALFQGVAMADSITVKKGDTLWKLSQQHHTSVNTLKQANHLSSDTIYVGQKLQLTGKAVAKTTTPKTTPSTTYVVKSGDTLYKIGKKFSVRYQDIQKWNKLSSTTIKAGQKLTISGAAVATPTTAKTTPVAKTNTVTTATTMKTTTAVSDKREELIQFAKQFIGKPYKWGGTTPSGFDCSGFMYYTLHSENLVSNRTNVAGYWSLAKKVSNPTPGDLVFFQNTYKDGPSHMGIYLGNNQFIHAGSNGVAIDQVNSSYWKKHFLGYGTFF